MNERQALRRIKQLVAGGWVTFTEHAIEEMHDEFTTVAEVLHALKVAMVCAEQPNGRWRVSGGAGLTVIVEIQEDVVVVTVYGRT